MINFGTGKGRLAVATKRWAAGLESDLPGSVLVLVELARDAANLADGAREAGEASAYLRAVQTLRSLITEVEDGVSVEYDDGETEIPDEVPDEWERLVGADPDPVADTEDTGT